MGWELAGVLYCGQGRRNVCGVMTAFQTAIGINSQNWVERVAAQQLNYIGEQYGSTMVRGFNHASSKQRSAFALIMLGAGDCRRYVLQWNENWRVYNLIGGKMDNSKGDSNCFLKTICRELEEETGLVAFKDCHIGQEMIHLEMRQYSRREKRMKEYQFGVFEVSLFPQLMLNPKQLHNVVQWLSTGRSNVVVTLEEIANLMTVTKKPISQTTHYILQQLGHFAA